MKQDDEDHKEDQLMREVEILLPEVTPFSSVAVPLIVLAVLGPQRDAATVEHTVSFLLASVLKTVRLHHCCPYLVNKSVVLCHIYYYSHISFLVR